ncbi:MAG: PEGA domain-containing protein [Tepidisphaeraceae bacterium]
MPLRTRTCLLLGLSMGGCVERTMTINTHPQGAIVYLNNQEFGRTPVTRDFTWYGNYDVEIRKDGYETLKAHASVIAPVWGWPPIDIVAEVMPLRCKDNRTLEFTLVPASTQPADAQEMLHRAEEMQDKLESSESTRKPSTHPATAPSDK